MKNIFSKIKLSGIKEKVSCGLDIGTQSIKCIKLKFNGASVELAGFDLAESQLELTEVLKKIKHVQDLDFVNISFCGAATVIRYVNFLRMNKAELKSALKFEAQKHIPFAIDQVNLDAEILRDDLPENKMLVLIAAIKKELITQRIKVLEGAGLRPGIIDIDSLALVNAFNFNYAKTDIAEKKSICLLNIGATITNVNILDNGVVRLSRDIHSAGVNFTKKIMDIFQVDFKAAEELKINPPDDKSARVRVCAENSLTALASEIRTSFDYYESQNTSNVVKILLSGGASKTAGLKEMLSTCLGIPVETWDPFKMIKIPDAFEIKDLNNFYGQFNVAVGLALR